MKGVKIEIVKFAEGAGDGEIVIRLLDVFEVPEEPIFRIDPLDDDARGGEREGWPTGELAASKMRVGERGVEMSVSSDTIDWPALLPGTPVAISIPSASIREELRWPGLGVLGAARRGVVVVSTEKRRAEIAARAKARRAELEGMTAVRMRAEAEAPSQLADRDNAHAVAGLSRLDVKRKGTMKLVAWSDEARSGEAVEQFDVSDPATSRQKTEALQPPAEPAAGSADADQIAVSAPASMRAPPSPPPLPPPVDHPATSAHAAPSTAALPPLPEFQLAKLAPAAMPAASDSRAAPPPLPARAPGATPTWAMAPASTPPSLSEHAPKFLTRQGEKARSPYAFQRAFGLGFLVAALLALASTFALRSGGDVAALLSSPGSQVTVSKVAEQPSTLTTLSAILSVPDVSTRGEQVTSIDLAGALKKADQSLEGTSNADKEEAKYWLRRSLALGLGEQRLVWALTQLGTLYASPATGNADYASARTLWELAAAQKDPIALCFLASLHEHGLGIAKDEARALVLYRNAKTHGGCRNVDQSIARLTKGAP